MGNRPNNVTIMDIFTLWNSGRVGPQKKIKNKVLGIGINDADYVISECGADGKSRCRYYTTWYNLLQNCYSTKYQRTHKKYIGLTVCDEWLCFMGFRNWAATQPDNNLYLSNQLLVPRSRIYSPETCIFIPNAVKNIITSVRHAEHTLPPGVYLNKAMGKYYAQFNVNNKRCSVGLCETVEEAYFRLCEVKYAYIKELAVSQNSVIKKALLNWTYPSVEYWAAN